MTFESNSHHLKKDEMMAVRLMASQVAEAVDATISGSLWHRVDTFAMCRSRAVQTVLIGNSYETITGSEFGVNTRLKASDGETFSVSVTGPPQYAVEGSLEQIARTINGIRQQPGKLADYTLSDLCLNSTGTRIPSIGLSDLRLAKIERMILDSYCELAGVITFSELYRSIACENGFTLVQDQQVHRRLHLELQTSNGGVGEDGIVISSLDDILDPTVTSPCIDRALQRAVDNSKRIPSLEGRLPVIFSGGASGVLIHELVGHLLEMDVISTGGRVLADQLGSRVSDMPINIVDDPTLVGRWGSFNYDDEGYLATPTPLIVDGVVCGVLSDSTRGLMTGAKYSSHSARRASHEHLPLPRMSNLSMSAGIDHLDDVIGDLKYAVFCDGLSRGQVDPATGRFTLNMVSGRAIRSGRLCEHLAPAVLTGHVLDVLSAVRAICNDLDDIQTICGKEGQQILVEMSAPSLLVDMLEVTRS